MQQKPRKRTSGKEKPDRKALMQRVFEPEGNIAYLDAEFNAGLCYTTHENISDIISVGIVVCDPQYQVLERYYTLVKPLRQAKIFPQIKKMTGISQHMLEDQPDFLTMSSEVSALVKKHNVTTIYTWGAGDRGAMQNELAAFREKNHGIRTISNRCDYINLCTDVSGLVSGGMLGISGGLTINIENLLYFCQVDRVQEHNALSDAEDLFCCMKVLREHFPLKKSDEAFMKRRELINAYYTERSTYNSFRRFREGNKAAELYGNYEEALKAQDIRLRALADDIAFLKGDAPKEKGFDSISEFFEKNLE